MSRAEDRLSTLGNGSTIRANPLIGGPDAPGARLADAAAGPVWSASLPLGWDPVGAPVTRLSGASGIGWPAPGRCWLIPRCWC